MQVNSEWYIHNLQSFTGWLALPLQVNLIQLLEVKLQPVHSPWVFGPSFNRTAFTIYWYTMFTTILYIGQHTCICFLIEERILSKHTMKCFKEIRRATLPENRAVTFQLRTQLICYTWLVNFRWEQIYSRMLLAAQIHTHTIGAIL